ncbi:MAG: DUF1573 domain-containing protein [Planctomycetota bacterium]|nr:DUF1573 domain-containing protein [Planctomycetota bacterium]
MSSHMIFFSPAPTPTTPPLLLAILAALCGFMGAACAPAQETGEAALTIVAGGDGERANFHDLGTLAFGSEVEHVFSILNSGPQSVEIMNVRSACACSTPRLGYRDGDGSWVAGNLRRSDGPALVLPAGRTAELTLRVSTKSVRTPNRDKLVLVRLQSNSPRTPFLTFELHLIVERLFQATPEPLDLGAVPQGAGGSARTEIARAVTQGSPRVLGVISATPPFTTTLESWDSFGRPIWGLTANLPPGLDLGPVFGEVTLETTDRDGTGDSGRFTVALRSQVVTDWTASPAQLLLHPTHQKTASSDGTNDPADPVQNREARSIVRFLLPGTRQAAPSFELTGEGSEALEVSLVPPPGSAPTAENGQKLSTWLLILRAAPGALPARAGGELRLMAAGEDLPDLVLPWRAP